MSATKSIQDLVCLGSTKLTTAQLCMLENFLLEHQDEAQSIVDQIVACHTDETKALNRLNAVLMLNTEQHQAYRQALKKYEIDQILPENFDDRRTDPLEILMNIEYSNLGRVLSIDEIKCCVHKSNVHKHNPEHLVAIIAKAKPRCSESFLHTLLNRLQNSENAENTLYNLARESFFSKLEKRTKASSLRVTA